MRIDTKIVLKDIEGNDLVYQDLSGKDSVINKPMTIRYAFYNVLNIFMPDEIPTAEDKAKIYGLSVKLYQSDQVDLTIDDMSFIKLRAGKVATPIVYGRICELFEDRNNENKEVLN